MNSPSLNFGVSSQESLIQQQIHVYQLQLQQFLKIEELEIEQVQLGINGNEEGKLTLAQIQQQIQQVREQIQLAQDQLLAAKAGSSPSLGLPISTTSRSPKSPDPTELKKDYDPYGSDSDEEREKKTSRPSRI